MSVETMQATDQINRLEGAKGFDEVVSLVNMKWLEFGYSDRRTMLEIKIPPHIRYILIGENLFEVDATRRVVWFERTEKLRYNGTRFFLSQVYDANGKMYQLTFARSSEEGVMLVKSKMLGQEPACRRWSTNGYSID